MSNVERRMSTVKRRMSQEIGANCRRDSGIWIGATDMDTRRRSSVASLVMENVVLNESGEAKGLVDYSLLTDSRQGLFFNSVLTN